MTLAVEADDATAIIEVPADEGPSAAASRVEAAKEALEDAKGQAAVAVEDKEEDMAKVLKEMEAAGDEGRFAEEKRRLAEISTLKAEHSEMLRHLEEQVNLEENMRLMEEEERNATES